MHQNCSQSVSPSQPFASPGCRAARLAFPQFEVSDAPLPCIASGRLSCPSRLQLLYSQLERKLVLHHQLVIVTVPLSHCVMIHCVYSSAKVALTELILNNTATLRGRVGPSHDALERLLCL